MDRVIPYPLPMSGKKGVPKEKKAICASAKIVAENLKTLMSGSGSLNSNPTLAEATRLGTGTISRVKNAQLNPSIDTIEVLAGAFGLSSWQLLVPNLQKDEHPVLLSDEGRKLFTRLADEVGVKR